MATIAKYFYTAICGKCKSKRLTVHGKKIEYASPVWHSSLTVAQSDVLKSMQKRAMNIIFPGDNYTVALTIAGINTLGSRRETLTWQFFTQHVLDEKSCLHYLLPPKQDENITARLRKSRTFETCRSKTNRFYNSFIPTPSEIFSNPFKNSGLAYT